MTTNPYKDSSSEWWVFAARVSELHEMGVDRDSPEGQEWLYRWPLKKPRESSRPRSNGTCSVYRAYDYQGRLLYVGITGMIAKRSKAHAAQSEWWPLMVRQEWEHFPKRDLALKREAELISELRPLYNVAGRKVPG